MNTVNTTQRHACELTIIKHAWYYTLIDAYPHTCIILYYTVHCLPKFHKFKDIKCPNSFWPSSVLFYHTILTTIMNAPVTDSQRKVNVSMRVAAPQTNLQVKEKFK